MLRTEIEDLITQLFNQEKDKRSEAKARLINLEEEGEIVIEILQPHLEDDNPVTKSYAIGAMFRIAFKNKFKKIEEIFLKEQDGMFVSIFFENFLKEKEHSFEETLLKKIKKIESELKKHSVGSDKATKTNFYYYQLVLSSLPYFQKFGSKKCHSLLSDLLEHKNPNKFAYPISFGENYKKRWRTLPFKKLSTWR